MAIPITVPRLGWNMEQGTFGGWLKADGDRIEPGDRVFALESEKATEEIESLDGGYLRIPPDGPKPGDVLAIGVVVGYLVTSMDEPLTAANPKAAAVVAVASETVVAPASRSLEKHESTASSPRARRVAVELGVDWKSLTGSGRNGRIRERDVRAATTHRDNAVPITTFRRTIADRMLASHRETAPVTLTTTADASNLVSWRARLKSAGGPVPSFTDLFVKLVADSLRLHPMLGAHWTNAGLRLPASIDIGIAVDTEAGLLVPVVRNVPSLSLQQLATATSELIERARTSRLTSADTQGGCFTVTNLGSFGIDAFTPIINAPQCAILGIGRISRHPAVIGDAVEPRDQVTLSLTFDHRIVDGAPAARFLQSVVQAVENPAAW
ncbi:MAG TPA: dihydrolipoamide acetyltransferase family protein [Gemmataceae bacterium]|jgi:pyruvate dehydrogenase E2 component (dihydrolipoamide acetyltransferase)|nr:dihydrolipoamide acetyltransferase family protein [Gemmataceae bacterium]